MLAQTLEERTHGLDVSRRVGVEDDHIVEVGRHLKPFITSYRIFTNQPGETLLPWGMTSHSYRPVGVQNAVRGTLSLGAVI